MTGLPGVLFILCGPLFAGEDAQNEAVSRPVVLHNEERRSWLQPWKAPAQGLRTPVCCMTLPPARRKGWPGPRIRLSLPSFSGGTPDCPQLLQYTCQLITNVRAVAPARVQVPPRHIARLLVHCTSAFESLLLFPGLIGFDQITFLAFCPSL